jgi:HPr kinase/phosphorylase
VGRRARPARPAAAKPGPSVAVRELLQRGGEGLALKLVAGRAGLERTIHLSRVQRPGLALTGFTDYLRYGRVQIIGNSEVGYLRTLPARRRASILSRLARSHVRCFVVTKGLAPPPELKAEAEARGVPVLATALESTRFIKQLSAFLDERLAERIHLHSVLMDVFGLGVLIVGESGIGKSECALDLIDRGHRLVSDDVVEIKRMADSLVGASPDLTRYHMELRGLGVINIKDLYGVSSVRLSKKLELVVSLERWEAGREYDRLGLRDELYPILDVGLPLVRMPVAPGRNIALLVEVAARNQLLKARGYDAARRFAEQVDEMIGTEAEGGRVRTVAARRRARRRKPGHD